MPFKGKDLTQLFKQDVAQKLTEAGQKIMIDVDRSVVEKTPVDTGRAKGGWTAGSGGGGLDPSGTATIAALTQAALSWRIGQSFVVSNNLPYIERLENGWSDQAPAGMLAVSFALAPKQVKI